jgi:hypothetical protein
MFPGHGYACNQASVCCSMCRIFFPAFVA